MTEDGKQAQRTSITRNNIPFDGRIGYRESGIVWIVGIVGRLRGREARRGRAYMPGCTLPTCA